MKNKKRLHPQVNLEPPGSTKSSFVICINQTNAAHANAIAKASPRSKRAFGDHGQFGRGVHIETHKKNEARDSITKKRYLSMPHFRVLIPPHHLHQLTTAFWRPRTRACVIQQRNGIIGPKEIEPFEDKLLNSSFVERGLPRAITIRPSKLCQAQRTTFLFV